MTTLQAFTEHIHLAACWLERQGRAVTDTAINRTMRRFDAETLRQQLAEAA